jgi:uncharacterized protein (TIGR02284 family)
MKTNETLAVVLNDLVKINNDRVEGYEKAGNQVSAGDVDLKIVFYRMAEQSRYFINELSQEVLKLEPNPANATILQGKIYRAWMDVQSAFSGDCRNALLKSCEFGEDAAQRAYDEALASSVDMDTAVRQLIASHKMALKKSHDEIRLMRDMQVAG